VAKGALGFGIMQSIDPTRGRARLAELCEQLATDVGALVIPHHATSYRRLVDAFESGSVAIAWLPPISSAELDERGRCAVMLLPVRKGSVSYRSAIIANRKGPRGIAELRGKRMAWVDPDSSSGFLVPRLYLQGAGYDVARLFGEERFLASHAAVVDGVLTGRFDAGATYCSSEGQPQGPWSKVARAADIIVVATTGTIPNDTVLLSRSLEPELRSKILRWLLDLRSPRARALSAELFGADSFRVGSPAHYEPLKRILIAARARGTIPPPPG
jgi:phosphate/phosphite/phosphonate ABC transporter binding protein